MRVGASDATVVLARMPADNAGGLGVHGNLAPPGADGDSRARAEKRAPTAACEFDDQVLVVDEQPEYHLPGCRELDGWATIALSAREAVELEFVPCEMCALARELSLAAAKQTGPARERLSNR
jgi:hypothetical protein